MAFPVPQAQPPVNIPVLPPQGAAQAPHQLPTCDIVRGQLEGVKDNASGKILAVVTAAFVISLIAAAVLAIGFATGGIGVGVIAVALGVGIPLWIGAGGVCAFSDEIAQTAVPRELDMMKNQLTATESLEVQCNSLMSRYHTMDPVDAMQALPLWPPLLAADPFPLATAKKAACTKNPQHPPDESIKDLILHRHHGEACDFLWDIYTRELLLKNKVELALSIAALTKKTQGRFHRDDYYEQNKVPVQELLLETYRAVEENLPPHQLSPEERGGALYALAQMFHVLT